VKISTKPLIVSDEHGFKVCQVARTELLGLTMNADIEMWAGLDRPTGPQAG
jgi:hypothetical protein